jgi:restriction system protein
MAIRREDLPTYRELMYPTLVAVGSLGGSGTKNEIEDHVVDSLGVTDEMLELVYHDPATGTGSKKSIFLDRLNWALTYCKQTGVLDSPARALYALSGSGREALGLDEEAAREALLELDRQVRKRLRTEALEKKRNATEALSTDNEDDAGPLNEDDSWKEEFLNRLHQVSPEAFEEFTLLLLRSYGMSLERVGGSGDEGIDGIGTAPMSDVLSSTVAVQCKRYEPSTVIGREKVALFQRDAAAKGAERAVMVTLGRYSRAARAAARVTTPTVDLIDGDRLCELALEQEVGVRSLPQVDETWFERFSG